VICAIRRTYSERGTVNGRSQIVMVWWGLIFMIIYGLVLWLLLHMVPLPRATMSVDEIAAFYRKHDTTIKWGAVIESFTSAFMLPLSVVIAVQLARTEKGRPVWAILSCCSGVMMSIFLVLPPLFWGVAAYSSNRAPEVTALMHELGNLTLVTTDQFYIFMWVAITVICLRPTTVANSPFPRWMGYFTAWSALMFEAGAFAFLPRTGPFAWNGLLVFWSPFTIFGIWIIVMSVLLLQAIKRQIQDETSGEMSIAARIPLPS
jgi:hypothetical protein